MKTNNVSKVYTDEEKIEFYSLKLEACLGAARANENIFEKMFRTEQAYWIVKRLKRLMKVNK